MAWSVALSLSDPLGTIEHMIDGRGVGENDERVARACALVTQVLTVDPATATGPEMSAALMARAELASVVDGAAVAMVPRWEASLDWAVAGCVSPVVWLVNQTGERRSVAGAFRRTALLAASMPHVSAAARDGSLSLARLFLLTRARKKEVAEIFDRDEAALVAEAKTLTPERLEFRLEVWYHAALAELARNEPDPDPPPETDLDTASIVEGVFRRGLVRVELTPESLVIWTEAVNARIETWRRTGQLEGDQRSWAELVGAALTDLITDGSTSSRRGQLRPLLIATATLSALLDRADIPANERDRWKAEILGGGPLSQQALRELMEKANIVFAVTDDDGEPLYMGRARRLVTAAMLHVLLARSGGTCEFPGCHAKHFRCHAHHIMWWRNGGYTDIDNLVLLCPHHHRLVHHGWTLTRGPTGLDFRQPQGTPVPAPRYRNAS
jgi:hypothetical protein